MMRSMYAGVSGLRNHQTRMDVIGNNIANVNTTGYKKSRVVFKDTLYQSVRGASSPTDARGGTNPMAIGLGMTISSIDQIHTPSPAAATNKTTDLAIDGNGYFIVDNGGQKYYTRAGNFDFDEWGNMISLSNGYRVHGWTADQDWNIDTLKATGTIDISGFKTVAPRATTQMRFEGNLNSTTQVSLAAGTPPVHFGADINKGTNMPVAGDEPEIITPKEVYDSLGNKQILYFRYFKYEAAPGNPTATPPVPPTIRWACDICKDPEFENMDGYQGHEGDFFSAVNIENGTVDGSGKGFVRVYNIEFNDQGLINNPSNANYTLVIDRSAHGAEEMKVDIDFAALTQWESKSSVKVPYQDGYTMGNLTSYTIGIDGVIQGLYDNGETRNLARVALVNFQNPSGLLQVGSSLYQVSNNSGDPFVGAPGDQGMGALIPGSLEMSNVDLSEEFTDMIITQRGFQANSRIITTSDEMLQELVNLKR